MIIEAVRTAISNLNEEEREIIERIYFNDESIRSVADNKKISHTTIIKRKNKILEKLKKVLLKIRQSKICLFLFLVLTFITSNNNI